MEDYHTYSSSTLIVIHKEPTSQHARSRPEIKDFVLRVARKESPLQPYRLRNEVACLQFLAAKVPGILAPRVFALDDGSSPSSGPAFLFEDFIEGQRLSVVWPNLSESQKWTVLRQIASTVADLGETRFSMIGGLTLGGIAGPTIEAAKLFNGRVSDYQTISQRFKTFFLVFLDGPTYCHLF